MNNWLEFLVTAAIVVMMLIAIFRGGQSNPISTGQLERELRNTKSIVERATAKLGKIDQLDGGLAALRDGVGGIEQKVSALDSLYDSRVRAIFHDMPNMQAKMQGMEVAIGRCASNEALTHLDSEMSGRISKIEESLKYTATKADVAEVKTAVEHICRQNDKTDAAVVRIEQHLLGSGR